MGAHCVFGIPVEVAEDDGGWLVTDCVVNMYGVGDTVSEAVEDYKSVILEYFELILFFLTCYQLFVRDLFVVDCRGQLINLILIFLTRDLLIMVDLYLFQ